MEQIRYEYKTIQTTDCLLNDDSQLKISEHYSEPSLNELGAAGWELCGFATTEDVQNYRTYSYIFKRPLS